MCNASGSMSAAILRAATLYDGQTGKLFLLSGKEVGKVRRDGYVYAKMMGGRYLVHRLVWLRLYGKWPEGQIDHINGDRSDNRMENLRDVAPLINAQNQRAAHCGSSSGILGVSWRRDRQRWVACIKTGGRQRHLGFFLSPADAQAAYLEAKRSLHAGCAI